MATLRPRSCSARAPWGTEAILPPRALAATATAVKASVAAQLSSSQCLPLAASAVGGIPAFVESGANGLLFPSGGVEAAAEAVIRLLSDRTFAETLAGRGKADMEASYTWDAVADRVGAIYEDAVASRRGGKRGPR